MTIRVLRFVELSGQERKAVKPLGKLGMGDQIEIRIRRKSGGDRVVRRPPEAAALLEAALSHLLEGERVAVLTENQKLSPNNAAEILGISRPLVVHRMDASSHKTHGRADIEGEDGRPAASDGGARRRRR